MDFMQFRKRIGLKIKYYRSLKDMTQAYLAELVSCDESYMSLIENGRTNISLPMIYKITSALGVTASKIFEIED